MRQLNWVKALGAGLVGGMAGHAVMGVLFYSPVAKRILYSDPVQTELFMEIASPEQIPLCVLGIVLLSSLHGLFFAIFAPSIPGTTWLRKGLFWGLTLWVLYWVFQEWLLYTMLLGQLSVLNLFELLLLLIGSLVEGIIISRMLRTSAS